MCATAGGDCTLRAALQEANALAGDDIIVLPAGAYILTIVGAGENNVATGDLDIRENLTITGAGAAAALPTAPGLWPPRATTWSRTQPAVPSPGTRLATSLDKIRSSLHSRTMAAQPKHTDYFPAVRRLTPAIPPRPAAGAMPVKPATSAVSPGRREPNVILARWKSSTGFTCRSY